MAHQSTVRPHPPTFLSLNNKSHSRVRDRSPIFAGILAGRCRGAGIAIFGGIARFYWDRVLIGRLLKTSIALGESFRFNHAGNSYPMALSTSIVRCTAGRAIIRA
jgi:hypothetical protein